MIGKGPENSLSEFFRCGKMDNSFVVENQFVTGICVMYPERSAGEHEYMIREKSVVELDARGLSACVQEAKDLAYLAAVSRLSGISVPFGSAAPVVQAAPVAPPAAKAEAPAHAPAPEVDLRPAGVDEPDETTGQDAPEPDHFEGQDGAWPPDENDGASRTAQRFDIGNLRPASTLLPDAEESAYEKARNMKITILGKLHECCGWTAGRILDEKPEFIVEFAHRYNGPKTEERDALKALYTEALRRVNDQAA